jgi:hypothetical protein
MKLITEKITRVHGPGWAGQALRSFEAVISNVELSNVVVLGFVPTG